MNSKILVIVYVAAIFLSASLLFAVQPIVAKMLTPLMGGSSSVWTTSMLFFQTVLLAGYVYAHLLTRYTGLKTQVIVHVSIMLLGALMLPLAVSAAPDNPIWPAAWVLMALTATVGLPFFALSATSPLLQKWFSRSNHKTANDPYWLYSASNVGSLLALLSYPLLIEPALPTASQSFNWSIGYLLLIVGISSCFLLIYKKARTQPAIQAAKINQTAVKISWPKRSKWLLYSAIPSSLMLGLTDYITTDIGSVPLFWVIPLALYLLTFIIVFSRHLPQLPNAYYIIPVLALSAILLGNNLNILPSDLNSTLGTTVLHVCLVFVITLFLHKKLAESRPHSARLTEFYVWMSVGGALGGLFNSIIAPTLFDRVIEYTALLVGVITVIALHGLFISILKNKPLFQVACFLTIGSLVTGLALFKDDSTRYYRNYYTAYTVSDSETDYGRLRVLRHGTTAHGAQYLDSDLQSEAISYYHTDSGGGQAFNILKPERVGVVGLGVGGVAAYADKTKSIDFFEIDPDMEKVARQHFTYLEQCGEKCQVYIGDGRKLLEDWRHEDFDMLFMDAYSSDSIPAHLLTREAMSVYLSRISDNGSIIFHVSNRYLDVEKVVGALAREAGLVAYTLNHTVSEEDSNMYVNGSRYVIVARKDSDIKQLISQSNWKAARQLDSVWTDDFTNIISIVY